MKRFLIAFLALISPSALADQAEWIAILNSDSTIEQRARACQRLGEAASAEAIPALAKLLDDQVLNTYARTALERIGNSDARNALHSALQRTEGPAQIGIIQSIGSLQITEAIEDLTKLLSGDDDAIAEAAVLSLSRIRSTEHSRLRTNLDHASEKRRAAAATACMLAAQNTADDLTAAVLYEAVLESDVPQSLHTGATHQLILRRRSVLFLVDQIQSDNEAIRDTAFLALRAMPSDALADALHDKLADAEPPFRILLIAALRDCSNEHTVPILSQHLGESEGPIRLAVISTLASIGGKNAASALLGILDEEAAREALLQMEGRGTDTVIASMLANSRDMETRLQLIDLLGQRKAPEALQPLLIQANEADPAIRTAALKALRPLVRFVEIPELIALFKTSDGEARAAAVGAIVNACRQSASVDAAGDLVLNELTRASKAEDRGHWGRVLAALGHAASLPVIARSLDVAEAETVTNTIDLLGRWPNSDPIEPLFDVCERPAHRGRAISAILTLIAKSSESEQRVDWLQRALPHTTSRSEKRRAIELATPFLQDEEVREEAKAALKKLSKLAK